MSEFIKPPKSDTRWTDDDILEVELTAGRRTTKQIAKKTGRSVKAVQRRYVSSGVSPLTSDGRITLAEYSRRSGIPLATLTEWANMGKIPGLKKVGVYWRLNPQLVKEVLAPTWDGKKSLPLRLQELGIVAPRVANCINCDANLPRSSNYYCSKRCRGEDMHNFVERKISGKDQPDHHFPTYLRLPFQDFLKELGLLSVTIPLNRDANLRFRYDTKADKHLLKIREALIRYKGYVLPAEYISSLLGEPKSEDFFLRIYEEMFKLRSALEFPEDIIRADRLGYSFLGKMRVNNSSLRVLRIFWQKQGVKLSLDYLQQELAKFSNEDIEQIVSDISGFLEDTNYQIVNSPLEGRSLNYTFCNVS